MPKQAECYWCTEDIVEESVYDVKTYWYCTIIQELGIIYWNKGNYGYPICNKCIGNFKYGSPKTKIPNFPKLCKTCNIINCNNNFNNCIYNINRPTKNKDMFWNISQKKWVPKKVNKNIDKWL